MPPTPMQDTRTRGRRTLGTRNPDTTPASTGRSGSAAVQPPFSDGTATLRRPRLVGPVDRPQPGEIMPATGDAPTADALPTAIALPAAPPADPTAAAATVNSTVAGEEAFNSVPTLGT
jgi:hypothetical protein